jgi:acyl carrier protein
MKTTKKAAPKPAPRKAAPARPAVDAQAFEKGLVEFINARLVPEGKGVVTADSQLFEEGLINSIKILDLMAYVEKQIGHKIPDKLVIMKNFRSARAITTTFVRS